MHAKSTDRRGFTLVEIMIVVVIIGLLAAMAVPTWQRVRTQAQDKTITNNLRQIYAAAQQYFLESGEVSVVYGDLVGPDGYLQAVDTAAGEDYTTLMVASNSPGISVTKRDGTTVAYLP